MEGLESVRSSYDEGNLSFRNGNYVSAIESYSTGINFYFSQQSRSPDCCTELHTKMLLNRAQCYLNEREYVLAEKDCSVLIASDCSCLKAYIRRAIAYENLGNFRKGLSDIEAAAKLRPPACLMDTIVKLSSRLRGYAICDEKAIAAEGRPDRMVTDKQTLRLNFLEAIPRNISIGEPFLLRLCIGNEFGLWDRSFLNRPVEPPTPSDSTSVPSTSVSGSSPSPTPALNNGNTSNFALGKLPADVSAAVRVCFEVIHLNVDREECSSKDLVLNNTEDNYFLGPDGKISLNLNFMLRNSSISAEGLSPEDAEYLVVLRFSLCGLLPSGASVVPILSLPVRIRTGNTPQTSPVPVNDAMTNKVKDIMNIGKSICASCIRESHVGIGDVVIYVLESPGLLGIGGKVWDSTYVLVEFLRGPGSAFVRGKRIVELGSGTGITGLGLCVLNPLSVVLTDFAEVEPLLNANIELNCIMLKNVALQNCVRSHFSATHFSWGTDLHSVPENRNIKGEDGSEIRGNQLSRLLDVDVVIASDVVYDPVGYEPLVKSLCDLLGGEYRQWNGGDSSAVIGRIDVTWDSSSSDTINLNGNNDDNDNNKNDDRDNVPFPLCILAHRHRHPENQRFFESLRSQERIVVSMISRESGEEIIKEDQICSEISEGVLGVTKYNSASNSNINDGQNENVSSPVLSDVELYKIYFKRKCL